MTVLFPPTSAASIPSASEAVEGKARVATSAEVTTGTDNTTIVTPLTLTQKINATLSGGVEYKGDFNPSSPGTTLNNALKGDLYIIASGVTNVEFPAASGIFWHTGDHLLINTDMGGTLSASKIDKIDSTDSVASVAGKTGPVTLVVSDLTDNSILARLADPTFTGTPEAPTANLGTSTDQLATTQFVQNQIGAISSGALNDLSDVVITGVANNNLVKYNSGNNQWENGTIHRSEVSGLGTAAQADTGTTAGDVLVFSVNAQLPAVDGSQLTNLPSAPSATVTSEGVVELATSAEVLAGSDASKVVTASTTKFIPLHNLQNVSYTTPLTQGDVLTVSSTGAWTASAPSGGALSTLTDVTLTSLASGEFLKYNSSNTAWENVTISSSDVSGLGTAATKDAGTLNGNVVTLSANNTLPVLDGSNLTGIVPDVSNTSINALSDVDTATSAPSSGQLLSWDATNNKWIPATTDITLDTAPVLGANLNLGGNHITNTVGNFVFKPGGSSFGIVNVYTNSSTIGGAIKLWEPNPNGGTQTSTDHNVMLRAPSLSGNLDFILPNSTGTSGQVLQTSGSASNTQLSWVDVPAASDIGDIGNVSLGSLNNSTHISVDFLSYNGTNWVNGPLPQASTGAYGAVRIATSGEVSSATGSDVLKVSDITYIRLSKLNEVDETTVSSPTDGDVLTYDTSASKWKSAAPSAGASTDLTDSADIARLSSANTFTNTTRVPTAGAGVNNTIAASTAYVNTRVSLLAGDGLTRTGSGYSAVLNVDTGTAVGDIVELEDVSGNAGLPAVDGSQLTGITADLSSSSIDDLSDVDTTTSAPSSGQLLSWDGSSKWIPATTDITLDTSPVLGGNLNVGTHDIISTSNGNIELAPDGSGSVKIKGSSSGGAGRLVLNCQNNSHGVTIQSPPHSATATYTLTLPDDMGSNGQLLTTNGTDTTSWTGPHLLASNNLSDLNNDTTARANLGVAIGSDVQAYDAGLQSISALTTAADKMIFTTGADTYDVADLTQAGRDLLDDADASAQRTTLGLVTVASSGNASDVTSANTATNYTPTASGTDVDSHLDGINTKFASVLTAPTYSAITADTTAQLNYHYSIDTTSNAVTLTLPSLSGTTGGQKITVKFKTKGGSNNVTIARNGSDTIDKQTSYTLSVEHSAITLVGDGSSNWEII